MRFHHPGTSQLSGKVKLILLGFPTTYFPEQGFCQVLHARNKYRNRLVMSKQASLDHQEGRRVFWEGPKFFELYPIFSNYTQQIFLGEAEIFLGLVPNLWARSGKLHSNWPTCNLLWETLRINTIARFALVGTSCFLEINTIYLFCKCIRFVLC